MADVGLTTLLTAGILAKRRANPLPVGEAVYDKEKYNPEYNVTMRQKKLEDDIADRIAQEVHEKRIKNIKEGKDEESGLSDVKNRFNETERSYYIDELKDMLENAQKSDRKADIETQIRRLNATADKLAESAITDDHKKFLQKQYEQTRQFLLEEKKMKKGVGGVAIESAKNQISNYMDMRSLFSGLVDNNPLAMALFGIGSDVTKSIISSRKARKEQLNADERKQGIVQKELLREKDTGIRNKFYNEELESARGFTKTTPAEENPIEKFTKESHESIAETAMEKRKKDREDDQAKIDNNEFKDELFNKLDSIIDALSSGTKNKGPVKKKGFFDNLFSKLNPGKLLKSGKLLKLLVEKKGFLDNLFSGMAKKIPSLLSKAGLIGMVISLVNGLFQGITDGWNKFVETGNLSDAIFEGATSLLSGMTFSLISKESIQEFFDNIGSIIGDSIFNAVELFKKISSTMSTWIKDKVKSWLPDFIAKKVFTKQDTKSSNLEKKYQYDDKETYGRILDISKLKSAPTNDLENLKVETAKSKYSPSIKKNNLEKINAELASRLEATTNKQENINNIVNQVNETKASKMQGTINPTTIINNGGDGASKGNSGPEFIPLTSARNQDSSAQRIADRSLAFSWS